MATLRVLAFALALGLIAYGLLYGLAMLLRAIGL
jgi:hypothetical protein